MVDAGLGVGYWHPKTQFRLRAVERTTIASRDDGTHLVRVLDASTTIEVVPDRQARQEVTFDVGLLERLEVEFTFDDRGLLEAVNSHSSRDISPILSVIGKALPLLALGISGDDPCVPVPGPLEEVWDAQHPTLVSFRERLSARADTLRDAMLASELAPEQIVETGRALATLESYLASLGQLRREWIASQAAVLHEHDWTLSSKDLLRVDGPELPESLPEHEVPHAQLAAYELGLVLAVVDDYRPVVEPGSGSEAAQQKDVVSLRGSRPAQAGVYVLDADGCWALQRETVRNLDIVDELSPTHHLPLDGSWWREKKFNLAYHPDKSLKTFGLSSTSSGSTIAAGIGEVVDGAAATAKTLLSRPSQEAQRLARLKAQLDLAKTESDMEVLAATRARAAEVAVMEQEAKLRKGDA